MARPVSLTYVAAGHDADRLRIVYRRLLANKKAPTPSAKSAPVSPFQEDSDATPHNNC